MFDGKTLAGWKVPEFGGEGVVHVKDGAVILEMGGIALSSGSACSSVDQRPSHVLLAMGLDAEEAHSSLRLSAGRFTTEQEVVRVAESMIEAVAGLRGDSPRHRQASGPAGAAS